MKKLVIGILAHVDAGKTTLSESMLYTSGSIRHLGRVDNKDAYLDNNAMERERGITIFSKQAEFSWKDMAITLLDTPGHVDFSAEMERTFKVLDYAVLVISGADGVQGHTRTLWRLLKLYQVPVFLFINKMDQPGADKEALLWEIKEHLDSNCIDFTQEQNEGFYEEAAMCEEAAMEKFLSEGSLASNDLAQMIAKRELFPCYFGSALKVQGVEELLDGLYEYGRTPQYPDKFGAKIFKIAREEQGNRLTYLKVTGGTLRVKDMLNGKAGEEEWAEKVNQIRIYSGEKYEAVSEAAAGTVCAVTGLTKTYPGEGLGIEEESILPVLEPVRSVKLVLPKEVPVAVMLPKLKQLEEENPELHIVYREETGEILIKLMGEVQLEILQKLVKERYGVVVDFGEEKIIYKETIRNTVEGVGHFEPLRHYAEVHLLLEPGERGSGLCFQTDCSEDILDKNWQRLILTHLAEREHKGVLTGSAITDMKITVVSGRAHPKHTEGGDFRQATYRAVRQGLMCAQNILLEPFYSFRLELPRENLGRAINDIRGMGGSFSAPEEGADCESCAFCGTAPVSAMRGYTRELAAYTRGRGRLGCEFSHYGQCRNAESVIAQFAYDPERDLENTPDSVFCSHGAGVIVKWNDVRNYMHIDTGLNLTGTPRPSDSVPHESDNHRAVNPKVLSRNLNVDEKELEAIMLREFGPIKRPEYKRPAQNGDSDSKFKSSEPAEPKKKDYLIVDGYNIIFAWEGLSKLAKSDIAAARKKLMDILSNYCAYKKNEVILVFDGYKLKGNAGERFNYHSLRVAYTKENETADMFIERLIFEIGKNYSVRVATGDGMIQLASTRTGTLRMTARELEAEVESVNEKLRGIMAELKRGEAKTKLSIPPLPNGENED